MTRIKTIKPKTINTSFAVTSELFDEIILHALKLRISKSQLYREAVEEKIARLEDK